MRYKDSLVPFLRSKIVQMAKMCNYYLGQVENTEENEHDQSMFEQTAIELLLYVDLLEMVESNDP